VLGGFDVEACLTFGFDVESGRSKPNVRLAQASLTLDAQARHHGPNNPTRCVTLVPATYSSIARMGPFGIPNQPSSAPAPMRPAASVIASG
jgi:hypothetical protein